MIREKVLNTSGSDLGSFRLSLFLLSIAKNYDAVCYTYKFGAVEPPADLEQYLIASKYDASKQYVTIPPS